MLGIEVYRAISQIYTVHVHTELATSYSLRVPTHQLIVWHKSW